MPPVKNTADEIGGATIPAPRSGMVHRRVWTITGFLVVCGTVHAQITVSGRVVDENGTAVPQVALRFRPADAPEEPTETSTGPGGNFSATLPHTGEYRVTATSNGFFALEDNAITIDRDGAAVQFVLNHRTEILSSINVASESNPVDLQQTENQKTLSNLEILDIPYQGRDINAALKLIPGVIQDPVGGMHLSGGAANQVMYTLDGFNVTDPISGTFQTRMNVDSVRDVRYDAARYSPEFGKGSAGVVAVDTQMGNDAIRYNATNFVPGIDTASGLHIGTWSPRFELSGPIVKGRAWFSESADAVYSQFVVPDAKDRSRTSSLRGDNLLRTQVNLTPTNLVFASFLVNAADAPGSGLSALDPYSTTLDRRERSWLFSLKHDYYLPSGAILEWGYAEDRTLLRQIPLGDLFYEITPYGHGGNYFLNSRETALRRQWLINATPKAFHRGGEHQLRAGVDADRLHYDVVNRRTGYEMFGLDGTLLSRTTFQGGGVFSRPNMEASTYLLDTWKPRSDMVIVAGVRQDWDELLRNVVWSPRVSAALSPFGWKDTKLTAGYAVTRDASLLTQFARPFDQYAVTVTYNPDGSIASGPAGTYFVIPPGRLSTPLYRNWTAGLEQRLPGNTLLTASYQSRRGRDGLSYVVATIPPNPAVAAQFVLQNYRRDVFDSAEIAVRRSFGKQYEWMASYTRSRALSNAVLGYSVDQPVWSPNNAGRMPWDTPNHLLAWGYFPTPWPNWAVSALVEARDGLPFSVATDTGAIVGEVNSYRLPSYFDLDFHVERKLHLWKHYVALRAGFANLTNRRNPTVVNSVIGSPDFLNYYGSQGRHVVFRLRWLGNGK